MANKKEKITCKKYQAEVCEPKGKKVICKKKKIELCTKK